MKTAILLTLLAAYSLIATVQWIKWKISTRALVRYVQTKMNIFPKDEDLEKCSENVIKKSIKDLTRIEL